MGNDGFSLHPQLEQDTLFVTDLLLCRVLLMNESRYPWFILVPRRTAVREIHELNQNDRDLLWGESHKVSQALLDLCSPDKMNVASLGNMVPQLHLHHIARFQNDAAWPAPVWGRFPPLPYKADAALQRIQSMRQVLLQ